jgi:hypothetical protein
MRINLNYVNFCDSSINFIKRCKVLKAVLGIELKWGKKKLKPI